MNPLYEEMERLSGEYLDALQESGLPDKFKNHCLTLVSSVHHLIACLLLVNDENCLASKKTALQEIKLCNKILRELKKEIGK